MGGKRLSSLEYEAHVVQVESNYDSVYEWTRREDFGRAKERG